MKIKNKILKTNCYKLKNFLITYKFIYFFIINKLKYIMIKIVLKNQNSIMLLLVLF